VTKTAFDAEDKARPLIATRTGSPAVLMLEIDIGELLAVGVAHREAGGALPRRSAAAGSGAAVRSSRQLVRRRAVL